MDGRREEKEGGVSYVDVVTFKFMESDDTELIVNEIKKGSSVRHTLTLNVDTASWNEDETREFKVFIGGGVDAAILEAITVHGNIA